MVLKICVCGHTDIVNSAEDVLSFHPGSGRPRGPFSIPASSLSHPSHVRRHVDPLPLLVTPAHKLSS